MLVIFAILIDVAANGLWRATGSLQRALDRDHALFEARGGVRWAAERLSREGPCEALARRDEGGALEVEVKGDRIRSTYTIDRGRGADEVRAIEARWRRDGEIVVFEWSEE